MVVEAAGQDANLIGDLSDCRGGDAFTREELRGRNEDLIMPVRRFSAHGDYQSSGQAFPVAPADGGGATAEYSDLTVSNKRLLPIPQAAG